MGSKNEENLIYRGFWRKFDQENNFPEMAGRKLKTYFDFKTEEENKSKSNLPFLP